MPFFLFFAVLSLPLIEIASIVQVARWIGTAETILVLMAFGFFGLYLIRSQSLFLGGRIVEAMRQGTPPEKPLLDSAVVSMAGVLFMIPGFLSDILALVLLIPFARRSIWRGIAFGVRGRFHTWEASHERHEPGPQRREDVIDADFTEVPPEPPAKPSRGKENSPWRKQG